MKLRITQKGFENYTGQMGAILFENGVSVKDISERDALRLSALFGCTWDTGDKIKITRREKEPSAPIGRETYLVETDGKPKPIAGNDAEVIYEEPDLSNAPIRIGRRYSLSELEAIADKSGIKGLRDIAGPLGIKGTSINQLIDMIMKIAGKADPLPKGVEVVGD